MSLSSLLSKSTIEDHHALLKASEDALNKSKGDSQAQQVKAVALLKTDQYDQALKFFQSSSQLRKELPDAYAYSLYKTGNFEEAAKVAAQGTSRGSQHIALQAAYRAEDYQIAVKSLEALKRHGAGAEEVDLRINESALNAEGLWLQSISPRSIPRPTTEDLSTFETAYNAACISVAKGQLAEADLLLKRSLNLCEHNDELTDQEKLVESIPLKAQRLFVLQHLDKRDDAHALAKEIKSNIKDAGDKIDLSTRTLAQNNALTSSNLSNPFLARKQLAIHSLPPAERLLSNQASILSANAQTLDLQSFKFDGLSTTAKSKLSKVDLPSTEPDHLIASLFDAAARARSEVSKAAIKRIQPVLDQRPNDLGLVLTLIQLHVHTKNTTAAIDLLNALFTRLEESKTDHSLNIRYSPALIGLQTTLYKSENRRSQIRKSLADAATHYLEHKQQTQTQTPGISSLLQAAGLALLESTAQPDQALATRIFDTLYASQPESHATIAGYIASHAHSQSSSADLSALSAKLTPIQTLTSATDAELLESQGIPQSTHALALAAGQTTRKRAAATTSAQSDRKKRIRQSRLPKNFDPSSNAKPDPERWLPLRERSGYRPKKGRRKGRDDRTQGGGNVDSGLDISNRPDTPQSGAGGSGGGGGGKKGKKKGKR